MGLLKMVFPVLRHLIFFYSVFKSFMRDNAFHLFKLSTMIFFFTYAVLWKVTRMSFFFVVKTFSTTHIRFSFQILSFVVFTFLDFVCISFALVKHGIRRNNVTSRGRAE